jgi:hypothetical protein
MQTVDEQQTCDLVTQLTNSLTDPITDEDRVLITSVCLRLLNTLSTPTTRLKRQQAVDKVAYTLNTAVNVLDTIDAAQLLNRDLTSPQYKPLGFQYVEVESAYKHLLDTLEQASKSEWIAVVDTLTHCRTLDHDQLVQAQKHAAEKRRLFQEYSFLTASKFSQLLPNLLDDSQNKPRTLARWVKANKVLAMKIRGDWHYPAIQIDSKGEFYHCLQKLIFNAVHSGYSHWEIMSWIATPTAYIDEETLGKPLDHLNELESLGDVICAIKALPDDAKPSISIKPLKMLEQGDLANFEKVAYQWLGK